MTNVAYLQDSHRRATLGVIGRYSDNSHSFPSSSLWADQIAVRHCYILLLDVPSLPYTVDERCNLREVMSMRVRSRVGMVAELVVGGQAMATMQ